MQKQIESVRAENTKLDDNLRKKQTDISTENKLKI